jgi:hypothetical protein
MAFVIRVDDSGRISWLTPVNERGFPSLSDRDGAAVFNTREEAEAVVRQWAPPYERNGVRFSIEDADES